MTVGFAALILKEIAFSEALPSAGTITQDGAVRAGRRDSR